ncbi:MAG: geranylgeranyl diphosphate synthase, type [Actinomycetota bacterium]|nr:geranylgeranyl diphosphate synthase, type [Actinomycetota bacterium]
MPTDHVHVSPSWPELRAEVDDVLVGFLEDKRAELAALHPAASTLADELLRLVRSGGKRLRPALGYWGYRMADGVPDGRIMRAAASLELFHTFALIHDDVMDDSQVRRSVPAVHEHVRSAAARDQALFGVSAAIVIGDLAAVWADELLLTSGFDPSALTRALARAYAIRRDMAVGQFLDIAGEAAAGEAAGRLAANLKGGRYTVTGPLLMGAELASEGPIGGNLLHTLVAFGEPLGEAFQLKDDLDDGDAAHGATADTVKHSIAEALTALGAAGSPPMPVAALTELAMLVKA